ncbi:MAG TPA: response regulator [Tepidisphaeraceae bacterium]|jgi:DNA-binding response OmpR family regulator|nr:response regulator [Tepidisphaeraceae bacterium]
MKPASILVTDDESGIRLMLRTALESDGYSVTEASNGRDALEAVKARTPDLMVLDLNMPVLDGMAVLEQMKSLAGIARPRVIILTAYGSIPAAVKATRLGALDFLEKPITPTELRQVVRSVLDEPELDSPPEFSLDVPGGYELVLMRIRKLLRLAEYESAMSLLMKAADRNDQESAAYFNLLGVLYEAQRKWRLARKCYGKALDADDQYQPARANLRRLLELQRYGRSSQAVLLGDEAADIWYAKLPQARD